MANDVETYIETASRERVLLRYEAIFWGIATVGAAIGAAILIANSTIVSVPLGIAAALFSLYSYVKRDETQEEYRLTVGSNRDEVAAKHWAQELGYSKLVDGKTAARSFVGQSDRAGAEKPVAEKMAETSPVAPVVKTAIDPQAWTDKITTPKATDTPSKSL